MGRAISGEHRHETFALPGVLAWKNVFDLSAIQEIIHETQPEIVIEIGCKFGGTTLWLSDIMKTVAAGRVLSIDLARPAISVPENVDFNPGGIAVQMKLWRLPFAGWSVYCG